MKVATFVANYPGYCCWHFARATRHQNAKRNSGGFLVMVKEKLAKLINVSQKSDNVVWVTLRARGNAQCHAGFVYIPPMSSSLNVDECPFKILQREIIERRATGSIFLAGDFNSRTGNLTDKSDAIDFERHPHIMKTRVNDDQSVNTYGKRLLELVRNNNMVIFNGRTCFSNGTINSHFTCFRYNGASVVDYVIADKDIINSIKQFEVLSKTPDSDHCSLTFALCIKGDRSDNNTEREYKPLYKYTWNKENTQAYLISLEAAKTQDSLDDLLCDIIDDSIDCNEVVKNFYICLEDAIQENFIKRGRNRKSNFPKNIWFEGECKSLKTALHKCEKRDFKSAETRELRKRYKRTLQRKKRQYKQGIAYELEHMNTNDPAEYWKFWRRYKSNHQNNNHISIDTFNRHYMEMSKPTRNNNFDYEYMAKISTFIDNCSSENDFCHNEYIDEIMNAPITETELACALRRAKCGKASGADGIPVEFYKNSNAIVSRTILALFNYIFQNGVYPDIWSHGIVNPIFKAGKMCSPENFRKITLLSSLGKCSTLFSTTEFVSVKKHSLLIIPGRMASNKALAPPITCLSSTPSSINTKDKNVRCLYATSI